MGKLAPLTAVLISAIVTWPTSAKPHSWYPKECCHHDDCAPVESVLTLAPPDGSGPQLLVRSKHGTVLVPRDFPVRQSKDSRMHICVRDDPYGSKDVMCLFMPPSM